MLSYADYAGMQTHRETEEDPRTAQRLWSGKVPRAATGEGSRTYESRIRRPPGCVDSDDERSRDGSGEESPLSRDRRCVVGVWRAPPEQCCRAAPLRGARGGRPRARGASLRATSAARRRAGESFARNRASRPRAARGRGVEESTLSRRRAGEGQSWNRPASIHEWERGGGRRRSFALSALLSCSIRRETRVLERTGRSRSTAARPNHSGRMIDRWAKAPTLLRSAVHAPATLSAPWKRWRS